MRFTKTVILSLIILLSFQIKMQAQPKQLYFLGFYPHNPTFNVCLANQYAIISSVAVIKTIDYSNVFNPVQAQSTPVPFTTALLADQQNLFLGGGMVAHFTVNDISNLPMAPVIGTSYDWTGTVYQIARKNAYCYLATNEDSLYVIDITNTSSPITVGRFELTDFTQGTAIFDDYLYVGSLDGLRVYSISNPLIPTLINNIPGSYGCIKTDVSSQRLNIYTPQGVKVFDISSPSLPILIETFTSVLPAGANINPVSFSGNNIFRLTSNGVEVFEYGSGTNTALEDYVFAAQTTSVECKDSLVFVTTVNGLTILKYGYDDPSVINENNSLTTSVLIYPNPVTNEVTVDLTKVLYGNKSDGVLIVYDQRGSLINQIRFNKNDDLIKFSVLNYSSGKYLLSVNSDGLNVGNFSFIKK